MATRKPRITVTLSEKQYEVLKTISDNSGQAMSAFVGELLEQTLPVLERMALSFRRIKLAQDEQKKRIAKELDEAQTAAEPFLAEALGQFDLFMSRVEEVSGVKSGTEPAMLTPVTNRGVTPPLKKGKKSISSKDLNGVSTGKKKSKKGAEK